MELFAQSTDAALSGLNHIKYPHQTVQPYQQNLTDFTMESAKRAVQTSNFERIRYMLLFNRYSVDMNRSASGLASSLNLIPTIMKNLG